MGGQPAQHCQNSMKPHFWHTPYFLSKWREQQIGGRVAHYNSIRKPFCNTLKSKGWPACAVSQKKGKLDGEEVGIKAIKEELEKC